MTVVTSPGVEYYCPDYLLSAPNPCLRKNPAGFGESVMTTSGGVIGPASRAPISAVVFLVGTNPQQIDFISELLGADGLNVVSTSSREDVGRAIRRDMPDLVIANGDCEEFDSLELCKYLKCDRVTADIPILLLTNAGDHEGWLEEAITAGVDDFVEETRPAVLRQRLETLLRARKQTRAAEGR
jgi:PleD family two-component response regulator